MAKSCRRRIGSSGGRDPPVDVVENILMRLSAKDVLRCKLLSKTYYSLIKSTRFVKTYDLLHRRSTTDDDDNIVVAVKNHDNEQDRAVHNLYALRPGCPRSDIYAPPAAKLAQVLRLVGSCNGLLCAHLENTDYTESPFLVWNPTTRDHLVLPAPLNFSGYYSGIGFGYDAVSDDYKLVKICFPCKKNRAECWSMKSNSWTNIEIGNFLPKDSHPDINPPTPCGIFTMGNLHWLVDNYPKSLFLLSFDLATNCFHNRIPLPDAIRQVHYPSTILELMGSLAVSIHSQSDCYPTTGLYKFDIWLLKVEDEDDNNYTWSKVFSIGPIRRSVEYTRFNVIGKFVMSNSTISDFPDHHQQQQQQKRYANETYFWYDPLHSDNYRRTFPFNCLRSFASWRSSESLISPKPNQEE